MEQFSTEVFKIVSVRSKQNVAMYKLVDLQGDNIEGQFYESEIIPVDKSKESSWFIETILIKRMRRGMTEYFVKWDGFPNKFNSWVDSDEVIDKLNTES